MLFDAHGRPIYPDGVTGDVVRDAIQAAALADDFQTAQDIADRYGLDKICLNCGEKPAAKKHLDTWRVCEACKKMLTPPDFSTTKMMMQGLVTRDVQ